MALAQIDPIVGDLDGNRARILEGIAAATRANADVVVFPELATTGYPPEDLLLRPGFLLPAAESPEQLGPRARGGVRGARAEISPHGRRARRPIRWIWLGGGVRRCLPHLFCIRETVRAVRPL